MLLSLYAQPQVDVGWADREDCCDADGLRECIPSCCLWSSAGLTVLPPGHADAVPLQHILERISGAVTCF
jgi:hypothetical protein